MKNITENILNIFDQYEPLLNFKCGTHDNSEVSFSIKGDDNFLFRAGDLST